MATPWPPHCDGIGNPNGEPMANGMANAWRIYGSSNCLLPSAYLRRSELSPSMPYFVNASYYQQGVGS